MHYFICKVYDNQWQNVDSEREFKYDSAFIKQEPTRLPVGISIINPETDTLFLEDDLAITPEEQKLLFLFIK